MKENTKIKDYFSWGIIGSPNGFQKSVQGVDTQFNFVQYWDLNGEGVTTFPSPSKTAIIKPLYCLHSFYKESKQVTALAQYCSVRQQGIYRTGTYAGAFIEAVNANLNQPDNSVLFDILWDLTKFNIQNFVDMEKLTYKENISNVHFATPKQISQLELKASYPFINQPEDEVIFIALKTEEERNALISIAIENYFINDYQKIYFSSNPEIIENFKTKTSVECISVNELSKRSKIMNYSYSERFRLNNLYLKSRKDNEELQSSFQTVLNNKVADIQNKADTQLSEYKEALKHKADGIISEYKLTIDKQEQELSRMRIENKNLSSTVKKQEKYQEAVGLFKGILQSLEQDGKIETAFVSQKEYDNLSTRLENVQKENNQLKIKCNQLCQKLEDKSGLRLSTIILCVFNIILIAVCIYLGFFNNQIEHKKQDTDPAVQKQVQTSQKEHFAKTKENSEELKKLSEKKKSQEVILEKIKLKENEK